MRNLLSRAFPLRALFTLTNSFLCCHQNLPGTTTSLPRPLDSRRSQSPGAYQISPGSSPDTSRGQSRSFLSPTRSSPRSPTLSDSSGGNPPSPQGSPPSAFFPPSLISRRSPSPAMSTRSSEDGDGLHPGKEEPSRAHAQQNQEEVHGQQPYGPFGDVRRSLSSPEPVPMGPLDTPGSVLDHQNFELEPGSHSPPEFRFTGSPYSHSKVGQTSTADRALNTTGSLPELSGMLESGSKQPGDGSQPVKKQATSSPGTGAIGVRNPNQHVLTRPAHLSKFFDFSQTCAFPFRAASALMPSLHPQLLSPSVRRSFVLLLGA